MIAKIISGAQTGADRAARTWQFGTGFLTAGGRLRVLLPNDSENYYTTRELVPQEFADEIKKATIVITNYHAFKLRERIEIIELRKKGHSKDQLDHHPDLAGKLRLDTTHKRGAGGFFRISR